MKSVFSTVLVYKFYLPNYGGIEVLMHTIAEELKRRGIHVKVLTLRYDKALPEVDVISGVEVHRIEFKALLLSQIDIGVGKEFIKEVLSEADIVHIFSSIPSHLLVLSLKLCKDLRKTCIWQPIFIPNRFRYHKSLLINFFGNLWDRYFLPRLARYPHGLIALTNAEAKFFQSQNKDLMIEVLGECVKEAHINSKFLERILTRYGLTRNSYILSVGRIAWYKGYDLLVDAWRFVEREYPWLKLVIVGRDWGYKRELLARIRRYGLKNVVILENVPGKELHALYEGSLFVVQLSRFETFHRIALEAWSHGKPIVALDLGPATEHIRGNDAGILVCDNVSEVVSAIKRLIEDAGLRASMGSRGYEVFREKYSVPSYVDKLLRFYEKVSEAARA